MGRRVLSKQTNFASGELTAALEGRSDLDRYYNGCRTMLNWYPVVQGGVRRAPGTVFAAELFGPTRLIPFEASSEDQYLFVLRPELLDIYQDDALIQTLATPWGEDDLFALDYTQALDTCIVVHEDHAPRRIYRDANDIFFIEDLLDTGNTIHITNVPTEPPLQRWFPSQYHVPGEYIKPQAEDEADIYYVCTAEGESGSSAPTWPTTGTVSDGSVTWAVEGAISDIQLWGSSKGYPRAATFHEDRLVFAGFRDHPHRFATSKSGDYFNFDLGIGLATDGIDREILADELPIIQWVYSGRRLIFGTTTGSYAVIQTGPITPSEMQVRKQTGIGSARITPVDVDGAVLHVTRNGDQLRELVYSDTEQAFASRAMSILSPNAVSGATQTAAKDAVDYDDANLVYVVNADGTLGVLNTLREQEFLSWCRRSFRGVAESIASLGDRIYIAVSFTFGLGVYEEDVFEEGVYEATGSSSNRFLCYFDDDAYLDYQVTQTEGTATDTWDEFVHLAGQEVQHLVDGMYAGTTTVSDAGVITTEGEFNTVTAGVAIPEPTLELMPVSFDAAGGNISHLLKRLVRVFMHFSDTKSLFVDGDQINFRKAEDNVFAPIEAFTGVKDITKLGWDREATITITAPEPLPAYILSITREVGY